MGHPSAQVQQVCRVCGTPLCMRPALCRPRAPIVLAALISAGTGSDRLILSLKSMLAVVWLLFICGQLASAGQANADEHDNDKRSLALGRMQFRPGKRDAVDEAYAQHFDQMDEHNLKLLLKRSLALGRMQFRPGKRGDDGDDDDDKTRVKRSLAVGRADFRPGKRSLALGRVQFRPGKRSLAMGRYDFRPGKKRSTIELSPQMCSVDEVNNRRELMQLLWNALEEHSTILDNCQSAYGMLYEVTK